jgi:hypothetical protein
MKTKYALVASLACGFASTAGAFSLDFVGLEGSTLPPSQTIAVPGYGDVVIEAVSGILEINDTTYSRFGTFVTAVNFQQGDSIRVTFTGLQPINVDFDFVGVSPGEQFVITPDLFVPQAFLVTLDPGNDGAGLKAIGWQQIPEPSTALLGGLGMLMLLRRRR